MAELVRQGAPHCTSEHRIPLCERHLSDEPDD
jgi:hypothetical protein